MIASAGTVTDTDGNVYQTVRIGNQIWTVENLRVARFNDGTAISLDTSTATWDSLWIKGITIPAYCYYNNMTNTDSITKWGALYNWYAVNTGKLAPKGWHVPTDSEWEVMQNYLVINGYNYDRTTDTTKTLISYNVLENSPVSLRVYSLDGHLIQTLVNAKQAPGHYGVPWDGTNDKGRMMARGAYLYQLISNSGVISKKMNFVE
jgi:uncharacterized protein (TIGR02145 family)